MRTILTIGLVCSLCLALGASTARPAETPDLNHPGITVEVASGRTFAGDASPRSDGDVLWLRSTRGSAVLVRPIRWDSVVAVKLADQRYTGEEFRTAMETVRKALPQPAKPDESGATTIEMVGTPEPPPPATAPVEVTYSRVASVSRPPNPIVPIGWLDIDVELANWDGNVEPDGVLVEIRPHDAGGALVAVDGTLTVDLVGKRNSSPYRPNDFVNLGSVVQPVLAEDFGLSGATYRIPFQAPNPVFDMSLAPRGLVHARLVVAGQGVVEASDCSVRLRPGCSFRDDLWQATGSRYWPREGTKAH